MGRGILRGAGGDENLKFNFIWPNNNSPMQTAPCLGGKSYPLRHLAILMVIRAMIIMAASPPIAPPIM